MGHGGRRRAACRVEPGDDQAVDIEDLGLRVDPRASGRCPDAGVSLQGVEGACPGR
ncbi:MAG: hypothetical protein MZV70_04890 [Desulfobacterales bacterium]|nr:hypothetical protein [Desulfobacterales bacterium]